MIPRPVARFTRALVHLGHRRPIAVLLGTAVIVATGVWLGLQLSFDTDVLNLMPRHDPVVENFRKSLEEFGTLDSLLVAIPIPSEDHLETSLTLVDALDAELRGSPNLSSVQAHLEDPVKLVEAVLRHAVLFLDADGLAALQRRLTPEGLAARAADIRAAIEAPHGMLAKEFAVRDPLGFLPLLLGRVSSTPVSLKVDYSSGYLLAADHSFVLLIAKPVRPAQDIDFDRVLFADLRARVERAREKTAQDLEIALAEVPDVMLGGGHRIALEDASLIKSDIVLNSVSSVAGVMLLFFLAYRRFAAVHYAFLPLSVGLAITFGFASLTLGSLSSATSGFAALLVGLGIDFTIVLYGRYIEVRHQGLPIGPALDEMVVHSGPAVVMGSLTTVATFYAFFVTRFSGLREFGLLTGTGIVFMALAAFVLLPALVTVFDRGKEPATHSRWLDLRPLMGWSVRKRRGVLAVAAVVTLAALAVMPRVEFNDDVRNLRSPDNQGVAIQEKVTAAFGLSFHTMMVRVEAGTEDEVLARVRTLAAGLDRLVDQGVVASFQSVASLLPAPEDQERALRWVEEHRKLTDPTVVTATFGRALREQGLNPEAFGAGLAGLGETLRPAGMVTLAVWKGTPVEQFVERSLHREPGRTSSVINVYPPPGEWRREAPQPLVDLVATVPGASLTGVNLVSQRLRSIVWRDAGAAGILGLVLVAALLAVELRSLAWTLACLLPPAVGVLWTLGVMVLFRLPLNLLNVFVITMIIGIGSDYGIHMLHRIREGAALDQLSETARAVGFAALTTIVGFGSLVTTHYPGLRSIGWMTSMGVCFSCLAAIVVLPLLMHRGRGE